MNYQSIAQAKIRTFLFEWQNRRCAYCQLRIGHGGEHNNKPTLDHFIPLPLIGSMAISNLLVACARCNTNKGKKIFKTITEVQQYVYKHREQQEGPDHGLPDPKNLSGLYEHFSAHAQMAEVLQKPVPRDSLLAEENYWPCFMSSDTKRFPQLKRLARNKQWDWLKWKRC